MHAEVHVEVHAGHSGMEVYCGWGALVAKVSSRRMHRRAHGMQCAPVRVSAHTRARIWCAGPIYVYRSRLRRDRPDLFRRRRRRHAGPRQAPMLRRAADADADSAADGGADGRAEVPADA